MVQERKFSVSRRRHPPTVHNAFEMISLSSLKAFCLMLAENLDTLRLSDKSDVAVCAYQRRVRKGVSRFFY